MNLQEKMAYLLTKVVPGLRIAFERGGAKYTGSNAFDKQKRCSISSSFIEKTNVQDINHVSRCHVEVRLREAEEAADNATETLDTSQDSLEKIESAIGYLVLLHARITERYRLSNVLDLRDLDPEDGPHIIEIDRTDIGDAALAKYNRSDDDKAK